MSDMLNIEVVYAMPDVQMLLKRSVPAGTTVADAIRASGMLDKHPEIDLDSHEKRWWSCLIP
jgi:putative ubiquitin-RnfH superfamily antitoxin RatB of RatAB toxin-antitoxin module